MSSWSRRWMFMVRLLMCCLPLAAAAGDYPDRPVHIVVAFPPGGGTDAAARLLEDKLAAGLGQPIVIDNRAGAAGMIGAQAAARSAPDGYTLFFGTGAELIISPATRRTSPYDVLKDFTPIAEVGTVAFALVVSATSPINSVDDLIAKAAATPQGLNFSSFGVGSTNHLIGEMFKSATHIRSTHIAYKGSQEAVLALIGGQVDYAFETTSVVLPQIKAGKLKAIATPSPQRLKELPNVPTLRELGYQDLSVQGWMGVLGPAGMPQPIVQRVNATVNRALALPEIADQFASRGVRVTTGSPQDFQRMLRAESQRWRQVIQAAGISLAD